MLPGEVSVAYQIHVQVHRSLKRAFFFKKKSSVWGSCNFPEISSMRWNRQRRFWVVIQEEMEIWELNGTGTRDVGVQLVELRVWNLSLKFFTRLFWLLVFSHHASWTSPSCLWCSSESWHDLYRSTISLRESFSWSEEERICGSLSSALALLVPSGNFSITITCWLFSSDAFAVTHNSFGVSQTSSLGMESREDFLLQLCLSHCWLFTSVFAIPFEHWNPACILASSTIFSGAEQLLLTSGGLHFSIVTWQEYLDLSSRTSGQSNFSVMMGLRGLWERVQELVGEDRLMELLLEEKRLGDFWHVEEAERRPSEPASWSTICS